MFTTTLSEVNQELVNQISNSNIYLISLKYSDVSVCNPFLLQANPPPSAKLDYLYQSILKYKKTGFLIIYSSDSYSYGSYIYAKNFLVSLGFTSDNLYYYKMEEDSIESGYTASSILRSYSENNSNWTV